MDETENTEIRENTGAKDAKEQKLPGEDELLRQIDAFRDKAAQITRMINQRERRVKELEALVRSKEDKNRELQESLNKKQAEADSLVVNLNERVDEVTAHVKQSLDAMETKLAATTDANRKASEETAESLKAAIGELQNGLSDVSDKVSEKIHSENVKEYRNIQDVLQEMDDREDRKADADAIVLNQRKHKKILTALTVLGIIDLAGLAAAITLFITTFM